MLEDDKIIQNTALDLLQGKITAKGLDSAARLWSNYKTDYAPIVNFAKEKKAIPFAVFKPTGFGRFELYEKLGEKQTLSSDEQAEWNRVVERFDRVCKAAHEKDIALLIDGEEQGPDGIAQTRMDYSALPLPVIRASAEEMAAHEKLLDDIDKASGGKTLWRQTSPA